MEQKQDRKRKRRKVIVWVHGTRMVARGILPYFYRSFPGLQHISEITKVVGDYHNNIQIATSLSTCDPDAFPYDGFHFFGWNGHLSENARMEEAKLLRQSIVHLLASTPGYYYPDEDDEEMKRSGGELKDEEEENQEKEKRKEKEVDRSLYDKPPKLTLMTHSHGGNLALNMILLEQAEEQRRLEKKEKGSEEEKEKEKEEEDEKPHKESETLRKLTSIKGRSFAVSKLVLLACPILDEKKNLVADKMLKKVYYLYSSSDFMQLLGSSVWFKQTRCFPESSNLTQQGIGYAFHVSFVRQKFLKQLPTLLQELRSKGAISSPIPEDTEASPSDEEEFKHEYEDESA